MARSEPVLGVGLMGLGNSGWYYHAEGTLEHAQRFNLAAVCAATPESAARGAQRFGCRGYSEWDAFFADPGIDLVVVALPHHLHAQAAVRAATAGKHIVVEKPMAPTTAECDEMIRAADEHGVVLTVFQQRRWEADFSTVRRAVADGQIGDVWNVQERRSHRGKYQVRGQEAPHVGGDPVDWVQEEDKGGGVAYLIGPHLTDHVLHLVDRPLLGVSGRIHRYPGDEVEHYIDLHLRFEGLLAQIEIFRETAVSPARWTVHGTEGSLFSASGNTVELHRFDGGRQTWQGLPPLRACDPFYADLYGAIVAGSPLPVTPQEGRAAARVLELGLRSAEQGSVELEFPDGSGGVPRAEQAPSETH